MATILLLGAEKSRNSGIASLLRQDRHVVYLLRDLEHCQSAVRSHDFDLIVVASPPSDPILINGGRGGDGFPTPILIIQEDAKGPNALRTDDRVIDRILLPFTAEDLLARVDALVRVRRVVRQLRADSDPVEASAHWGMEPGEKLSNLANRLSSILNARIPGFERPPAPYAGVADRIAVWADRRDAFALGHAERVSVYAAMIADKIGLSEHEKTIVVRAARLHDIGKIALPRAILHQRAPLAGHQKRLLETHAERGASILQSLNADPSVVDAIRHHHARFDGEENKARALPWCSRVLAVAEVYDAMTSTQFRPALTKGAALKLMSELRGGQLDPTCVNALVEALRPRPEKVRVAVRLR